MTEPKQIPLLFTAKNRAVIRQLIKTQTRRVKWLEDLVADKAVWDDDNLEWDFYLDGHYQTSHKCPYGNPQVEPVEYWVKEPVQVLTIDDRAIELITADFCYCDGGKISTAEITKSDYHKLMSRQDWRKPSSPLFMLKSFTRTWLTGKRTWPEKLGDISEADAISEGIEFDPVISGAESYKGHLFERQLILERRNSLACSRVWKDYLNGGSHLTPVQSYVTLWKSIHGPGSWNPEQWVWCVEWEVML